MIPQCLNFTAVKGTKLSIINLICKLENAVYVQILNMINFNAQECILFR